MVVQLVASSEQRAEMTELTRVIFFFFNFVLLLSLFFFFYSFLSFVTSLPVDWSWRGCSWYVASRTTRSTSRHYHYSAATMTIGRNKVCGWAATKVPIQGRGTEQTLVDHLVPPFFKNLHPTSTVIKQMNQSQLTHSCLSLQYKSNTKHIFRYFSYL